jgi:hypothetical protein
MEIGILTTNAESMRHDPGIEIRLAFEIEYH